MLLYGNFKCTICVYTYLIISLIDTFFNYDFFGIRWNQDPKCDSPFPFPQSKIQKTLDNIRKEKYQKSPQTVDEIRNSFNNPSILSDLGTSLHRDRGVLYNYTHEEKDFSYSIFSSPKSIELICDKEVGLDVDERFFLIDATFRITPMCSVFDQVLIIHAQFGLKVR